MNQYCTFVEDRRQQNDVSLQITRLLQFFPKHSPSDPRRLSDVRVSIALIVQGGPWNNDVLYDSKRKEHHLNFRHSSLCTTGHPVEWTIPSNRQPRMKGHPLQRATLYKGHPVCEGPPCCMKRATLCKLQRTWFHHHSFVQQIGFSEWRGEDNTVLAFSDKKLKAAAYRCIAHTVLA